MSTLTEARLLEKQGYIVDAVKIYEELGESESLKKYKNINPKVLEFFIRMKNSKDYEKFKMWSSKWK